MSTTRRGFFSLSGGIAAFLFSAPQAAGQAMRTPTPSPTPSSSPTPTPSPAAEASARAAQERYGKFLTDEERKLLDERMAAIERRGARLRAYKLGNSEEPATDFRAVRR